MIRRHVDPVEDARVQHPMPLFDSARDAEADEDRDARERWPAFRAFHLANPEVFVLFRRFAMQARGAGRARFGARMIGERIRWYSSVEVASGDEWKINNNFWPYYARMLMLGDESFAGLFELRDAHFDATDAELVELVRTHADAEGA